NGPAFAATQGRGQGRGGQGRGGQGRGRGQEAVPDDKRPGLMTSKFKGGYTDSFWVGDAATGEAREFWHNEPNGKAFPNINTIQWAGGDRVVFQAEPEEWIRYYSVSVSGGGAPVALTPGEGMVENVGLSSDGTLLYYCTNAGDIDHRHVWKVPTSGGQAVQLTKGDTIETYPAALESGKQVAVLSADATRPQSVGIVPAGGGAPTIVFPTLPQDFPIAES